MAEPNAELHCEAAAAAVAAAAAAAAAAAPAAPATAVEGGTSASINPHK